MTAPLHQPPKQYTDSELEAATTAERETWEQCKAVLNEQAADLGHARLRVKKLEIALGIIINICGEALKDEPIEPAILPKSDGAQR